MACQKPAVSTPLPECKRYEEVFVAETYKEFVEKIDQALAARGDAAYLSRIERLAKEHTWNRRAETIDRALKHGLAGDSCRTAVTTGKEASSPPPLAL